MPLSPVASTLAAISASSSRAPDGLRVEVVRLNEVHLPLGRRYDRDAQLGDDRFLVMRYGQLIAYCRDIEEVAELGEVDLAHLHGPREATEGTG